MIQAKNKWIWEVQKKNGKGKIIRKTEKRLHLFRDDSNLWRCGGRIRNEDVPYQVEHP